MSWREYDTLRDAYPKIARVSVSCRYIHRREPHPERTLHLSVKPHALERLCIVSSCLAVGGIHELCDPQCR